MTTTPEDYAPETATPAPAGDAKSKLAALRARRAELEAERSALETPTEDEQLVAEQRAVDDAAAINRAIQQHGRPGIKWEIIETDLGKVLITRCSAMRYKKFQDVGEYSVEKCEQLIRPNIIYPETSVLNAMLAEQPIIAVRCANALGRMAGVRRDDVEKK